MAFHVAKSFGIPNKIFQIHCSSPSRAPDNQQDTMNSLDGFDALEQMAPLEVVKGRAVAQGKNECDVADFLTDDDDDEVVIFLTEARVVPSTGFSFAATHAPAK